MKGSAFPTVCFTMYIGVALLHEDVKETRLSALVLSLPFAAVFSSSFLVSSVSRWWWWAFLVLNVDDLQSEG